MTRRIDLWMWAEACEVVRQAERMQRRFFEPMTTAAAGPGWEPPVDMFETDTGIYIVVALPGVDAERLQLSLQDGVLSIRGERLLSLPPGPVRLHRLEIPNGHFERHIPLPGGWYRVRERTLAAGCLTIILERG